METFIYEGNKLNTINKNDDIWFRAKTVALILKYSNHRKAIIDHVDPEDKSLLKEINIGSNDSLPLTWNDENSIYINESGLYSLILRSDMDNAKKFKRWITKEVLPSIRKNGRYELNHKPFKMLAFNIQTEFDLHKKVVNFIRNNYPKALFTATLGENQFSSNMRLRSYILGYQKGSPDLIIQNLHKSYSGFAIEFKSPQGYGNLTEHQNVILKEYLKNGFKVLLSNDYDNILKEIIHYFNDVRILCSHCFRKFKSATTLKNHTNHFHKKY